MLFTSNIWSRIRQFIPGGLNEQPVSTKTPSTLRKVFRLEEVSKLLTQPLMWTFRNQLGHQLLLTWKIFSFSCTNEEASCGWLPLTNCACGSKHKTTLLLRASCQIWFDLAFYFWRKKGQTDGRTDERTGRRTDRRADRRTEGRRGRRTDMQTDTESNLWRCFGDLKTTWKTLDPVYAIVREIIDSPSAPAHCLMELVLIFLLPRKSDEDLSTLQHYEWLRLVGDCCLWSTYQQAVIMSRILKRVPVFSTLVNISTSGDTQQNDCHRETIAQFALFHSNNGEQQNTPLPNFFIPTTMNEICNHKRK